MNSSAFPRRLLFLCATALASSSTPMFAADATPAAKPLLGSAIFDWDKLAVRPTANGVRRDVANHPTATLKVFESHITTLNPGQASHAPHQHAQEEMIIVKEGTLEIHINGETQPATTGSTIFFASNDSHALRNVGDKPATYFVINLATAETTAGPSEAAKANPKRLRSGVWTWEKLTARPSRVGEGRAVFDAPTLTLANLETHITTVNAGEAPHAAHRHPDEEVIVLREGTLEVNINGQLQRAGPGSIFFYGSNDLHGMRNVGETRATYHVIRMVTSATPKPAPAAAK